MSNFDSVWEFEIKFCPIKLKIKIIEEPSNSEYPYTGVTNYLLAGPKHSEPYRALHPESSYQKALESALDGFFRVYEVKDLEKIDFGLDPKWEEY